MSSPDIDIPPAPQQKDTMVYDADGRLSYSIVNEGGKMVYRPGALSAAEQANKAMLEQRQNQILGRLDKTPEEYTRAAQESADAYASSVMSGVDKSYGKNAARLSEVSNTRGLLGSSAWKDLQGDLAQQRLDKAAQVSQQATGMRDALVKDRIGQDIGLFNLYKSTNDANWAKMMSQAQYAGGQSNAQRGMDLQQWGQQSQNAMNEWNVANANDPWNKYIMPTLTTGAMVAGAFSDRRLKSDIKPEFIVNGIQFYSFNYVMPAEGEKLGLTLPQGRHIGVMADEVSHLPGVVIEGPFGYKMVDYEALRRILKMEVS